MKSFSAARAQLTNKGTVSENRSSAAAPASMETIAAQRGRQRTSATGGTRRIARDFRWPEREESQAQHTHRRLRFRAIARQCRWRSRCHAAVAC